MQTVILVNVSNLLHQPNARYLMNINNKYVSPACFGTNVLTSESTKCQV